MPPTPESEQNGRRTKKSAGRKKSAHIGRLNGNRVRRSTYNFNRQILLGEIGALLLANVTAPTVSHFTRRAAVISASAVAATLIGGTLGWLTARIRDHVKEKSFTARSMAADISYFTPAALFFGFFVYDPAIYLVSHHLLTHGAGVWVSVIAGQIMAFSLFLLSLNLYRFSLIRFRGRAL